MAFALVKMIPLKSERINLFIIYLLYSLVMEDEKLRCPKDFKFYNHF